VFVALACLYLFWVELVQQGWRGVDTLEDTGAFCCGAGFVLYAFRETNIGTGDFCGLIWDLTPLVIGWATYLTGGAIGRMINRAVADARG